MPPTLTPAADLAQRVVASPYSPPRTYQGPIIAGIEAAHAEVIDALRARIEEATADLAKAERMRLDFVAADCRARIAELRGLALDLYPAAFTAPASVPA